MEAGASYGHTTKAVLGRIVLALAHANVCAGRMGGCDFRLKVWSTAKDLTEG